MVVASYIVPEFIEIWAKRDAKTVGEYHRWGEKVRYSVYRGEVSIERISFKNKGDDEEVDVEFTVPYTMFYEGRWTDKLNCRPYKAKKLILNLIKIIEDRYGDVEVEFSDTGRKIEYVDRGIVTEGYRVKVQQCQFFAEFLGLKSI